MQTYGYFTPLDWKTGATMSTSFLFCVLKKTHAYVVLCITIIHQLCCSDHDAFGLISVSCTLQNSVLKTARVK